MTAEQPKHNRKGWAPGPWDGEPDRVEWRTSAGLPALIVRQKRGHLCGYVAVPPGHPAYERSWVSEDRYERGADGELDYDRRKANPVGDLCVHGGVTYAEKCAGEVCHVAAPGEPDDVWWIGFDMAHAWDLSPKHGHLCSGDEVYRTVDYARGECESLAAQLAAMVSP